MNVTSATSATCACGLPARASAVHWAAACLSGAAAAQRHVVRLDGRHHVRVCIWRAGVAWVASRAVGSPAVPYSRACAHRLFAAVAPPRDQRTGGRGRRLLCSRSRVEPTHDPLPVWEHPVVSSPPHRVLRWRSSALQGEAPERRRRHRWLGADAGLAPPPSCGWRRREPNDPSDGACVAFRMAWCRSISISACETPREPPSTRRASAGPGGGPAAQCAAE